MPDRAEAVQVRYSENMIRDAVRTFVRRRFILEQKLLWTLAGAMLLLCAWMLAGGDRSWAAILAGTAALLPLLFVLVGWRAHLDVSLGKLRAMPEPEAEFAFDEQGFRVTSGLGEFRLPWSSMSEVWTRPDFWMLIIAPNQFATLPTQNIPPEILNRLRGWLGGKMTDL